jgi:hypothetical protein
MSSSKKFFVTLIVLTSLSVRSFAQETDTMAYKHYEFGPLATLGLSVFQGDVPEGSKTDIHFPAFTFAIQGIYSFHPYWGAGIAIGYESRGMWFKKEDVEEPNEDFTLNYITIRPSIKFKQFLLGVNIGIPSSNNLKIIPGSGLAEFERSFGTDTMNTMIDIRAEGMLPITESETGALYLHINASYCVSDAIGKGGFTTVGQNDMTPVTKSPIPTVQIGLSYLFAPDGKEH